MWSVPYFNTHTLWCLQDGYPDIDHFSLYCIIKWWTSAGVIFVPLGTSGNIWRHWWLWQLGVVLLVSSYLQSTGQPLTHHKEVTAPSYNIVQAEKVTRTAAAAKSLQSCPTLCHPTDGSPPSSALPGILQVRTLQWVAISFSNAWKWKVKVKSLSRVWLFTTPWTEAYHAPPSMGFSRQGYWSVLPLPSPVTRTNIQKFILMCYSSGHNKEGELRLTVHNCFYGQFNPGIYSTFGHSEPIFIKFWF